MNLLILLIGNAQKIIESNKLDASKIEIVKLDEKVLANPRKVIRQIKLKNYENVYFGTIALNFQRFQTFIKIYLFLTKFWKGTIVDEDGRQNKFTIRRFLFIEVPLFILEIIWSGILIIFYHLKVLFLKWKYKVN
jgi:hypothetical protein